MTDRETFLLTLPEPKDRPTRTAKAYVQGMPDVSMLNADQATAYTGLQQFFTISEQALTSGQLQLLTKKYKWALPEPGQTAARFALLKGYAGTGKTFLVGKAVHYYLSASRTRKVCMTAPTNKAVKIMREQATYAHTNLEYMTVHSLLALREQITNDGKQVFVRDQKREPQVQEFDLIIIDEVSMLDDSLFDMLFDEMQACNVQVLFVGDPCQIPPVNRVDCIPFNTEKQAQYGIQVFELTTIVRQAEGNPLIVATLKIRNGLRFEELDLGGDRITDQGGVIELSSADPDDMGLAMTTMRTYFTSENFTRDPDFFKVIAWTNKTVDATNDLVRTFLYGKKRRLLEIGERLIANTPVMRRETIQHNTNDELLVLSFIVKEDPINDGLYKIKYYEVQVEHLGKNGTTQQSVIWVVHEDSVPEFGTIVKELAAHAKRQPKGSVLSGQAWREFFQFQRRYADVKYNYAITAHKSQGSTYDNVMVMLYDVAKNPRVVERNRILYTACSRPRKKLVLVGW